MSRLKRHLAGWSGPLILTLALYGAGSLQFARASSPQALHIAVAGVQRDYLLVAGEPLPPGPRPLVLLLHGHLGTAANALGTGPRPSPLSQWLRIAERERIYVAALQGLVGPDHHTGWRDCRGDDSRNPAADDVAFAAAVAHELIDDGRVDSARIYVMGMSNGAMMSFRLALEMQPAPAAIAAVSGAMAAHSGCVQPQRPVSVLIIQGTADPLVPYQGGAVGLGHHRTSEVIGAEAGRDFWLQADGLSRETPRLDEIPHLGLDDTRAQRMIYGAPGGPQVEFIRIVDGGHVEPSRAFHYGRLYGRIVGEQNHDFESAEEAWRFFAGQHAP